MARHAQDGTSDPAVSRNSRAMISGSSLCFPRQYSSAQVKRLSPRTSVLDDSSQSSGGAGSNSMNRAAPALNGLRPCFLCGGSPGSDALAVVDVHEPSEQRSSVRPMGPPLRVVTHRESLM